jgi:hypothetical protein
MSDTIDSPWKLRQVIEEASARAELRREKDPAMNVVAFFSVTDFLEALTVAILRCRLPEAGFDPKGIIFQISDMAALFEHRMLEHMQREYLHAAGSGEFEFLHCFHGTPLRALQVAKVILSTINKFTVFGQGPHSYDVEAVEQNMLIRLRDLAATQKRLSESA